MNARKSKFKAVRDYNTTKRTHERHKMQTLIIQTDSADFIAKAKEILTTLAKFDGVTLSLDDDYPLYDDGKSHEQRIADYQADLDAIRRGELKTLTLDELRAEAAQW